MRPDRRRRLGWPALGAAGLVVACSGAAARSEKAPGAANQGLRDQPARAARDLTDPCVLVTRAEAEGALGPLAGDPYRIREADGQPRADGSSCLYRGAGGQSIRIQPEFTHGQMAMKVAAMGGRLLSQVVPDESGKADTFDGDWDEVRWLEPGVLYALKGDALVQVDVAGSRAGVRGAAALAAIAVKRFASPLDYDGARAARQAPSPLVAPRDACALLPSAEASAILGPLAGDPVSRSHGCAYPLARGEVVLEVKWTGGWLALNQNKSALRMFKGGFQDPIVARSGAQKTEREMARDPDAQKFLKQIRGVAGKMGMEMEEGSLTPKLGGSSLEGPWEEAIVLGGASLAAVKKDVYLTVSGSQPVGLEKAKALVAKAIAGI